MSSTSETGHTKNVANLKTLNTYLASLGTAYNPSKASIQLAQLQSIHSDAEKALADIQTATPPFIAAVDAQEAIFKPLDKLVTRIVRAYKATIEDPAEAESAISLQKKINGKGGKTKPTDEPADGKDPVSTSQLSYDNRQSNFQALVELVSNNTKYKPNETELQVASLETLSSALKSATEAVDIVAAPLVNARIIRDKLLYKEETGLVNTIVKNIKDYIISVFGSGSPQIRYINKLKFRAPRKK